MTSDHPANGVVADLAGLQIDQLAAIHAALNTDALDWQRDILLSAAVKVLTSRDLTCEELAKALNRMWATEAVTAETVEQALARGKAARLVVSQPTLDGPDRWTATAGAREDSEKDQQWARWVVSEFEKEVIQRFGDAAVGLHARRHSSVTGQLMQAMAVGAHAGYEVDDEAISKTLRPARFDQAAADRWIDTNVAPATVRDHLKQLLLAALNPLDTFAKDVLHLIVLGHLVRGVMARHDVGKRAGLGNTRLLLDTSVLVDLVDEGEIGQLQLLRLVEMTRRLGGEIVVAHHTLDEWERLWAAADTERPDDVLDDELLPENTEYLVSNKLAQIFLRMRSSETGLTWVRFQLGRRDIRNRLVELGINVRAAGNNTRADQDLEVAGCREIEQLDLMRGKSRRRRRPALEADSASLAMVARWRRAARVMPSAGYFCARDTLTGLAYKRLVPDDSVALTVNPEGWLLFVAQLVSGDTTEQLQLVALVGSNVVRESFFGLAAGFGMEDAIHLSRLLHENGRLGADDLQAVVQLEIDDALNQSAPDENQIAALADKVMRRRSHGRDDRALRLHASAMQLQQQSEADVARTNATYEREKRRHRDDLDELSRSKDDIAQTELATQRRLHEAQLRRQRKIQRGLVTALLTIVASAAVAASWIVAGAPPIKGVVLHVVAVSCVLYTGLDATLDPDKSWTRVVLGVFGAGLFAALEALAVG